MDQPTPTPRPQRRQPVSAEAVQKLGKELNSLASGLRILEERYNLMRNKGQVSEQNLIELEREMTKDLKSLNDDIIELKHDLKEVTDKLRLISSEIQNLVSKDEFRVLERYIDMWQPMSFVTRGELAKLARDKKA